MGLEQLQVKLNPDVIPAGSDLSIVNAARRSFNKRSDWEYLIKEEWDGVDQSGEDVFTEVSREQYLKESDKRLLQFLARGMTAGDFEKYIEDTAYWNVAPEEEVIESLWQWRNTPTHSTPFDHTFISFEVKAPIFVARQLVKHEYLIFSEFSRRYITDDIEFYEPDYWRKAAPNKKQGSLEEPTGIQGMATCLDETLDQFKYLLEVGVAPEQARMVLPQSTMTEWTWSGTLGAFAKMCQLRLHPEAQYESRIIAQQVYEYLKEYYPVAAKCLVEGPDV